MLDSKDQNECTGKLREQQREYNKALETSKKINHPIHYNKGIETTDYICSWDMDFCEGNIIKYVTRWKYKDGVDDLRKARWYLDKLIKTIEDDRLLQNNKRIRFSGDY